MKINKLLEWPHYFKLINLLIKLIGFVQEGFDPFSHFISFFFFFFVFLCVCVCVCVCVTQFIELHKFRGEEGQWRDGAEIGKHWRKAEIKTICNYQSKNKLKNIGKIISWKCSVVHKKHKKLENLIRILSPKPDH